MKQEARDYLKNKRDLIYNLLKTNYNKEIHTNVSYEVACERFEENHDWRRVSDDLKYLWFNDYMSNLKSRLFDEQSLKAARKLKRSMNFC